ncbi:PI-PLC X domain-containing protein At5g67130-like isoform X4 [Populus nigra]|uniref:PI-PLC X domain-containing protein At5g67130-like isoform X4 n=1 Tax=Populus nigra TaxID=3691 RepID=UPI002B2737EF|nr:PI-PLC X domain-containing protein At5g67130-like isoform X4 [Populus nigra]
MIIISFPNMVFSQNLLLIITASMAALVGVAAACSNGECRLHDECSSNQDCEAGLYCLACPLGFPGTRCVRSTITDQFKLLNGARALMLDTYDFRGDVWLCHSFKGKCHDYTAFGPAIDTLREIEAFLSTYPAEIVTIILEDYVRAPNGLTKVFTDAGLMKYWFPVTNMPKNGQDWPLVNDMVQNNQRLLVFTSIQSKEASEGIAYQWNYMVENQYGNIGMKAGSCTNRKESPPLNDTSRSLVLVNYFRCIPMKKLSCEDNSRNLINMLHTCNGAATNRWANFVAVDYYKRSEGGGSFQAVDLLNGKLLCGCDDIHACVEESQEEYNNNKGAQVELLQQDGLYITRSSDGLISRKEEIV